MKAIILAAGYATRLYPLTINKPKALLSVAGKPIIDYIVEELNSVPAIDCIYTVSNHKYATHFEEWAKDAKSRVPIKVLDDCTTTEENRLGAIGDINFCITNEQLDDDVVIIAGDNYFTFSLLNYYHFYKKTDRDCVCVKELDDIAQLRQFGVAELDENGKLIGLVEKPAEPATNIAVYATYMYKRETLPLFQQYLDDGNKPDAPGNFVQWLYTKKDVYAYVMDGDCYDIGTPKVYEEIQEIAARRT